MMLVALAAIWLLCTLIQWDGSDDGDAGDGVGGANGDSGGNPSNEA